MPETVLVKFPCGHIRQLRPRDEQFSFEPDGVRIISGVHYCQECYRQSPKRFTWLQPDDMFVYIDKLQELRS